MLKAKNPGTSFKTVDPQDETAERFDVDTVAELTSVEIGPIKDTPTKMLTKPPIRFAIIL